MAAQARRALVFAANTDLGKTLLSAALCRTAAAAAARVAYIKPIQTGYPADCDARFVSRFCPRIRSTTLFTFSDPVSPHLAAIREAHCGIVQENRPISDATVVRSLQTELEECFTAGAANVSQIPNEHTNDNTDHTFVLIETAGGVHSPSISPTLQSDLYRPFSSTAPCVLIGDSRLGGISTTLTAYEALLARGYTVPVVLMFNNPSFINHEAISLHVKRDTHVFVLKAPPEKNAANTEADIQALVKYFDEADGTLQDAYALLHGPLN